MKRRTILVALLVSIALWSPLLFAAETDPVPPNQLTPGIALVGPDATETYGSATNAYSGAPRERGNLFSVTTPANITTIEYWLSVPSADTFYFVIYRKTNDGTLTGTYTQDFITSTAVSTTGDQWVSSGTISYTLDPSYYYYLSVAWDNTTATYFRGSEATPLATGFGQLETGIPAGAGHGATWDNTYASGTFPPYYQRLTFDIVPVELQSLTVD